MRVALYGGFAEKGRTCLGVECDGYRLLLDAGVNTSARGSAGYYPEIDALALREFDAILITHAHEDHVAALGWFIACGFRGRIFMTPETRRESETSVADYAEPAHGAMARAAAVERLRVGNDVLQLGPLRISTGRSGHVAGGVWCRIDDGRASLVYCGDIAPGSPVFTMDRIARCDALVLDASYADDATSASRRTAQIAEWVAAHRQGCVLPTPLYGRSAELLAIIPGPIALATGMRDALGAQLACIDWLVDGRAGELLARLAAAADWRANDPFPRGALLCHDGMGIRGTSPHILRTADEEMQPTLFTGHLPASSAGERMVAAGRAAWIRLPTHPTLPENVALVAGCAPATVLGHSCDRAALTRVATHIPRMRADLATGAFLDV